MTDLSGHGLRVIKPGILTLLQDLGRRGYQHLGLANGGAADEHAFLWANQLLGNPANNAALEIAFGGLLLEAQMPTRIAITGADLQPKINEQPVRSWQTHRLDKGDQLRFDRTASGVWAYLAVEGGFEIEPTFGSVSTVTREGVGGLDGQGSPLKEGDWLPCKPGHFRPNLNVPPRFVPDYRKPLHVRVIEGHQGRLFSETTWRQLYEKEFRLSSQSDRMGVRLEGESLEAQVGGIISEGINYGAIQVPPEGRPIILLKDRQSIGGYPKLGTAFARDLFQLAQRQPGTPLRFMPMSAGQAEQSLREFYCFFGV